MPFDPTLAVGYAPTMDEIMADMGITSPDDFRETILSRCKQLQEAARQKGTLASFETTREFIVCE